MERLMEESTCFDSHQARCRENAGDIWATETHYTVENAFYPLGLVLPVRSSQQ